ncbi:CcmD family protein [candidate division KSB1 bacterium]|nr:CcmD family protein [candidate division KSB1 bacterium]
MIFLFAAFAVIWTGLFVFLLMIARRLTSLQQEVKSLRREMKSGECA